jgi:hypothetical protein
MVPPINMCPALKNLNFCHVYTFAIWSWSWRGPEHSQPTCTFISHFTRSPSWLERSHSHLEEPQYSIQLSEKWSEAALSTPQSCSYSFWGIDLTFMQQLAGTIARSPVSPQFFIASYILPTVLQRNLAAIHTLGLDANRIHPLCSPARYAGQAGVRTHCVMHLLNLQMALLRVCILCLFANVVI